MRSAQFVYLLPGDPYLHGAGDGPLRSAGRDARGAPGDRRARAGAPRASDERVTLIDVHARTTHGPTHDYTLTSAYIGFVLPLLVELQHLERHEKAG